MDSPDRDIIDFRSVKTRTGFIPNTKKVNQDAYLIEKNIGGI